MTPALPLARCVEPEILDGLGADDPRARRSRADLRRINRIMSTLSIVVAGIDRLAGAHPPASIIELGAGDGSLMARIARRRMSAWPRVRVTLLDRRPAVDARTLARIRAAGWQPEVIALDVDDWIARPDPVPEGAARWDVVIANLFVHHFDERTLRRLFAGIASRTNAFFCSEPRRSPAALACSRLVALAGAGPVTRADAVASVRAGFRDAELSAAWPEPASNGWSLREYDAGLFTHCLAAARTGARSGAQ